MRPEMNVDMGTERRRGPERRGSHWAGLCAGIAVIGGLCSSALAEDHPLTQALKLAEKSRAAMQGVTDYSAKFTKEELVGRRMIKQSMDLKLREQPFSVYLKFDKPNAGREVIFVAGANGDQLLVHETGIKSLAGTIALHPESKDAMAENRYPITKLGLANMLDAVIAQWEGEMEFGECEVKYYNDAKLAGVPAIVIESIHTQPRKQFKFHMTRLWLHLDEATHEPGLPMRVEQFGWPTKEGAKPSVVEIYSYSNIKPNVGLTNQDFNPKNPAYQFP